MMQMHGFTCGVDDLLIMKDKDIERKKQLEECEKKVTEAHYERFGVKVDTEIGTVNFRTLLRISCFCCKLISSLC